MGISLSDSVQKLLAAADYMAYFAPRKVPPHGCGRQRSAADGLPTTFELYLLDPVFPRRTPKKGDLRQGAAGTRSAFTSFQEVVDYEQCNQLTGKPRLAGPPLRPSTG